MVKDEDLCVHCGLCAERCPTAAWAMKQFDLLTPHAGNLGWPASEASS
jgi:ferredoxin